MPRYRLTLEYDGSLFLGWQIQAEGRTVQGELEAALNRLFGETIRVIGAGRTDSGVHATGQVAHFDSVRLRSETSVVRALNDITPAGLTVLSAALVDETFHARHSACYREYCYRIFLRREPPALDRGRVWHHPRPLDIGAMREAARHLLGTHDFSAFRASSCSAPSPIRTMYRLDLEQQGDTLLITVRGNAFLYHMVRNFVGSLVRVGLGEWSSDRFREVLESRDRSQAGAMAPAQGLYLIRVGYP